MRKKNS